MGINPAEYVQVEIYKPDNSNFMTSLVLLAMTGLLFYNLMKRGGKGGSAFFNQNVKNNTKDPNKKSDSPWGGGGGLGNIFG